MSSALGREEFADLVRDELGIDVPEAELGLPFDALPGWDSVHLLTLLVLLEKQTGAPLSLPDFLDAGNLETIYELVTR
ncbi:MULTISPECIES: phosphopantetheine-binding protein [unclassified Streptomyces]|uniref:phosphopantetheine-binding protein n=1 Tax=unclassified Streptomyces TaxID=2593676 RepID=UPI00331D3CE1